MYNACFEKRNYYIKIKLNTNNNRITETVINKKNSEDIKRYTKIYPSKIKSIRHYQERIDQLYNRGYETADIYKGHCNKEKTVIQLG